MMVVKETVPVVTHKAIAPVGGSQTIVVTVGAGGDAGIEGSTARYSIYVMVM